MFGSTILDVALGLVFVYFMLSLIASYTNNWIARLVGLRSTTLEAGMRKMLLDDDLANKVWNHPLVAGTGFKRPDYIPSSTFVVALLDAIAPPSTGGLSPATQAMNTQIAHLKDGHVKQQLTHIVSVTNNNMVQTREGIEGWFNASMERVTAEYKKKMELITLAVAFAISAILGVDTISLADGLWREPVIRAAIVGSAQQAGPTALALPSTSSNSSQDAIKKLAQYSLPIGWNDLPQDGSGWILKVIGIGLTTIAVSLGAPFWFDLLRVLSNVKNTVDQKRLKSESSAVAFPREPESAESESKKFAAS